MEFINEQASKIHLPSRNDQFSLAYLFSRSLASLLERANRKKPFVRWWSQALGFLQVSSLCFASSLCWTEIVLLWRKLKGQLKFSSAVLRFPIGGATPFFECENYAIRCQRSGGLTAGTIFRMPKIMQNLWSKKWTLSLPAVRPEWPCWCPLLQ